MGSNLWRDALQRLISNKLSLFGSIYILIIIFLALITPFIAPYDYAYQNLELGPSPLLRTLVRNRYPGQRSSD